MKPKVFISNHLFAFKERRNGKKDVEKVAKVWRCFFLSAIMTLLVITAQAETYYVSNSGSDSNSGTSTSLPWKTLDKVNSSSFKPGDQMLFKRGDEWTGTISVTSSGSNSGSIVYGAYGTGENPIIYGSQLLSGWTRHSANIYKAICNSGVTQLFLNDTRLNVARYPNEGNLSVSNVNSSVQFTSNGIKSAGANYYKGAKLNITTNEWRLDSRDVIASSGQTLTLDSETSYGLSKGQHFFLVNKLEFLDQPGQWYFDEATKTVYLWTPKGDSPDNYKVRGSIYSDGITVVNKNYITVKDLNLWQHSDRGINSAGANNTFENNSILYPETIGILNKGDNCKISGNTINGINHIGISHSGANGNISGNEILNTALFNNLGIKGMDGYSQAVASGGDNTTISYNRVINAGYNGIAWAGQNCNLSYNYIENVCTYLFDGGAIYTYSPDVNKLVSSGSVVSHNIIYNCRGTAALYMDNRTRDVLLEYNTVVNDGTGGNYGMFFHDNKNVKARYNTIFNMKTGTRATLNYGGNVFSNNIVCNIAETNANGDSPKLSVINSDEKTLSLDNNTYIDHHRTKAFMNTKTYSYLTFKEWQAATSQEGSSSIDNSALKTGEKEVLFFNDTRQVKTINLGNVVYKGIDGTTVPGKLTLQPFSSVILIQTSSVVPVNNKPQIDGQSFYIDEIKKAGDFVGQVIASDPDAGQALIYAIVSGNNDKLFTLDPVTGVISAGSEINFSEDKTVVLLVEVTDNATSPLSAQVDITIYIKATDLGDVTPPSIVSFSIPATSTSLTVPVQSFEASDNSVIGGYLLTESSDTPNNTDQGWSTSAPTSFTFSGYGEKILYAWVKDDAGNLSGFAESTVFIKDMIPVYTTEDISLCEGESYQGWTIAGQYTRTLQTLNGVDSIVTTNLYVNPGYNVAEDITINEGESYLGWAVSGEYQRTLTSVSGCDSIVTTKLTVVKSNTNPVYACEDISVCEGESYQGWETTGQYTRTLQTTDGIDSIVTTNLYVNPVYNVSEDITINEGESYFGWTVSGEYQRTLTSVSGCDSIVTTNLTVIKSAPVIPVVTQEIDLSRKWNIFSSYIIPEEKDMISILKDLTNSGSLVKVVDEYDRTFEQAPDGTWINNIGDFSEAQGYKILLESNSLLNIQGAKVSLPFEIHLNEGWNIISFPYSEAADAMDVVQSLIDENLLIKVQNEQGRSLEDWGRRFGWVNKIGDFIPGEGYLVKVNAPCTLTIQDSYLKSSVLVPEEESLVYFNRGYSGNAKEHMNIYVDLMESGLQAGDEIAAYDGEICVGAHKISYYDMANNSASLIVSLADEGEQNGFIAGNQIILKGWSSVSGREINIASEILSGEMIFQEGGSVLVQIVNELTTGINDNILLDVSMYPNPATSDFVVKLSVLPDIDTQVVISDISGKQMASRIFRSNIETFDVRNFPSGVYFVDIRIGNSHEVKKLVKQ